MNASLVERRVSAPGAWLTARRTEQRSPKRRGDPAGLILSFRKTALMIGVHLPAGSGPREVARALIARALFRMHAGQLEEA